MMLIFLDAALNHDVSNIRYYSLHCFTFRKKTNAAQFFYLIDFGTQFFWSDPMPCDLAKMLSHHLQSMFEFLTPQRRPGQRPYQQMNPNQMQSRAQDNSYVDRVYWIYLNFGIIFVIDNIVWKMGFLFLEKSCKTISRFSKLRLYQFDTFILNSTKKNSKHNLNYVIA